MPVDLINVKDADSVTREVRAIPATQPVSAASLPLPAGAATAAKQDDVAPAGSAAAVVPDDVTDLGNVTRALYVGGAGDVRVNMAVSGTDITFTGVTAGTSLPIRVARVKATGTTATSIVAIW